jgi:hypothetical protein
MRTRYIEPTSKPVTNGLVIGGPIMRPSYIYKLSVIYLNCMDIVDERLRFSLQINSLTK